jgi:imidazoleglycerol-phosphate dehydratase
MRLRMQLKERKVQIRRDTEETKIILKLNLDGCGKISVDTGIRVFDHLLGAFGKHGLFDIDLSAKQARIVDEHHIVEDVGIVMGKAIESALEEKRGIRRFGYAIVPMDDALALVALDLCGRSYFVSDVEFRRKDIGDLPTDLIPHFFESLSSNGKFVLHTHIMHGKNDHHKAEALFKALGVALQSATRIENRLKWKIPSQKGTLE